MRFLILVVALAYPQITFAQHVANASDSSNLVFFPFNGNLTDDSIYGNDGTQIGNPTFADDRFGNLMSSLNLDGEGDGVLTIPYSDPEFSISIWMKTMSSENLYLINNQTNFDDGIGIGHFDGIYFGSGGGSNGGTSSFGSVLNDGNWHHVVGIFNNNSVKIYVDNELDFEEEFVPQNYEGNFVIGRRGILSEFTKDFDGQLDDVNIYNKAIDEYLIDSLFSVSNWPIQDAEILVQNNISYSVFDGLSVFELRNIDLSDSLSAYQFDLEIPEGLTFTGLDTTSTLSSDGTFQTNVIDDTLKVAFSTTNYFTGNSTLVKLEFDAEGSGDYEIAPFNFVLDNMDIDSVAPGILSVVELLGDVDDNDSIQAYDGALALQYSVYIDPIPSIDALPWDIWRVAAADVDRDGNVFALDASYILQKTVDLIDEFPNSSLKSAPIELNVQQDGSDLVFSTTSDRLIGFNASIPVNEDLTFGEPTYKWEESIQAINQKEKSLEIGMASNVAASNEFLRIPFTISEEQTISIELIKNNSTQSLDITLTSTGVNAELVTEQVRSFELHQNYPNPFNPSTNINFSLPESQQVSLKIYDISGREIATLIDGFKSIGEHSVSFDASNLSSGVYIYQLKAGNRVDTKRMLLIK